MTFGYTILYVADIDRTVSFYEDAFGLTRRFVHDSGTYAEMDTGETTLAFAHHDLARQNIGTDVRQNSADDPPPGFEIALVTEDVQSAYERAVSAGATPLSDATQKPWGQEVAYVRDLDGVIVELCSPMSEAD